MDAVGTVIALGDPGASDATRTGGKGSNLAVLIGAGLPVPDGFVVTTDAYREFVESTGVADRIETLLAGAAFDEAAALETCTAEIRAAITGTEMPPALADAITDAYAGGYVAVRSSGTAEDLVDTSFAGLHDTFLDIRGEAPLLDAIRRCWASMWTSRATSYRQTHGIDHLGARLAVVVQEMVESEVAGVLFTANPMTDDTNEFVVNANWGLGESVVSGIATPDAWILDRGTVEAKHSELGAKEQHIVRDPDSGYGTVTVETPVERRARFTLGDDQLADLGDLARRVMAHFGGLPQDIEWAFAGDELFLLQSRPVTGAGISWDADVDDWQRLPDSPETVWTKTWADEQWTGAITPLFYSWRAEMFTRAYSHCADLWGVPEMTADRMFKFHKAEAYFNVGLERAIIEHTVFPAFRPMPNVLNHVPPVWHEEILGSPFSVLRYLKMHGRITAAGDPANTPYAFLKAFDNYFYNRVDEASGLPDEKLRRLSDDKLVEHVEQVIELEIEFAKDLWAGYYLYARDGFAVLGWMLATWYDGTNAMAFGELLSGAARRTATLQENIELLAFAEEIRASPALRALFDAHPDAAFFDALPATGEGAGFLARYQEFAALNAHRGHEERDIYFPRRLEDPGMDYRAWKTMLSSADTLDPVANEERVNARRDEALEEVLANLRRKPLGFARAEVFKLVHSWLLKFLIVRDDERYYIDRSTWAAKRAFGEINRRLTDRDLVRTPRDIYFLSRAELYEVLRRGESTPLTQAKIAARTADFDRFMRREAKLPTYLQDGRPVTMSDAEEGDGLRGVGTSHGSVTGRARVLHSVSEIGRVAQGDILVTNHTDPGWTPVFLVISGIVLETGGMLAHGSLLAREYGFPAVQVAGATDAIPDGALITVDGDTGSVHIHDEEAIPA